ncbi:phytase [candidate division KSB1 bacterium]|nr:phytase [candidate division KSB1 bacterium]
MKNIALLMLLFFAGPNFAQNGIEPAASTSPTSGYADDPAIWIHRSLPEKSVIIGTDKKTGIYVWDLNGKLVQHLPQETAVNNVDVRYDFNFNGSLVDIVAANLRNAGKLALFRVDPDYADSTVLVQILDKNSETNDLQKDSYGFCLYRRPGDGTMYVFERPKYDGELRQYHLFTDSMGVVNLFPVRDLNYPGGVAEGFLADDELGYFYAPEEEKGIHKYYADPDSSSEALMLFATQDSIKGDREGLCLYFCSDSTGYLLLSSQGNSTVKIYDRKIPHTFLGTVQLSDHEGKIGLGTDGLDVTSFRGISDYPAGFMVVHDEDNSRYHLYDWRDMIVLGYPACQPDYNTTLNWRKSSEESTILELGSYPNPFRTQTTLFFTLAQPQKCQLSIYNNKGQLVKKVFEGEKPAGTHTLVWDGTDLQGRACASGVYFMLFKGDQTISHKLYLIH